MEGLLLSKIRAGKLAPRATPGIFVGTGHQNGYKAYLVYDPERNFIRVSVNVLFVEDEFPMANGGKDVADVSSLTKAQKMAMGPQLTPETITAWLGLDGGTAHLDGPALQGQPTCEFESHD